MKKTLTVVLCIILAMSVFAACGKKSEETKETVVVNDEQQESSETETSTEDNSAEAEAPTPVPADEALVKASNEAYEKFLGGSELLHFDNLIRHPDPYGGEKEENLYDGPALNLEDFKNAYCDMLEGEWPGDYEPKEILYSYIDCGDDGIPELALKFAGGILYDSEYEDFFIIKYIDGELQLCYAVNAGYRSYAWVNKYGLVCYGGSNSAFSSCDQYTVIDGSGNEHFVYYVDYTYSVAALYPQDNNEELYQKAMSEGIADDLLVYIYDIQDRDEAYYTGDYDYVERARNCIYTYWVNGPDGEKKKDPSIYNEGNPYRTLWESTGLKFTPEEEVEELLWERKASLGVTDKIFDGEAIEDWTSIYR